MSAPELRPYQIEVIDEFHKRVKAGLHRIMLVAPTGSGKTIIGGEIVKTKARAHRPVLILAHRREIIKQTACKLYAAGIAHGIIQAGFRPRPLELVQLASIQTLSARALHRETMNLPESDLLWVDEAHHCPAETYRKIINAYPGAVVLGTTATPCRGDGRGLGGIFETLIETPQVADLLEQKFLVKTRVYAPVDPDLKGVRTVAGDYVESQLADRMDTDRLVGDIVEHWHKFGERRRTVCFAVSVGHSVHIRDEFLKSGVRAEHLDGSTPKAERDASLARLATGEIEVVTNCMVLTEGWDIPECGCIILARPTKKMGLYRQMIGRVLRPDDGKTDAIVLDHSGATFRHGFVEDYVEWTLDPDKRATSATHAKRLAGGHASRILECKQCGAVRVAGEPCFHCGYMPAPPPRSVEFDDGELGPVDRDRRTKPIVYDPAERDRWHAMLVQIGMERGYKAGWSAHKYKEKFGAWPPWGSAPQPIPPSPEVRSWVRSRIIAYAKARGAA
jgi:superfamily II DNA or RNA helicase